MSDAPIPISVPGSSSHARSSHPQGGKGKSRAGPSPSIKVAPDGTKIKKFRHRKTKEEVEFEKEGKRIAAGKVGEGGGVGVNKLKASLRQAKRLVVREGLPADVKTETERKIRALELDLEKAQGKNDEKKNATKYHMVKFFERQKLLRRLRPLLKTLSTDPPSSAKKVAKLEKEILDLRVGLNYVLNYPNSIKYISLFPPSSTDDAAESDDEGSKKKSGPILDVVATVEGVLGDKSALKRSELVEKVRGLMASGELSAKPEEDLQDDDGSKKRKRIEVDEDAKGAKKTKAGKAIGIEADDFFGGDDSESE